MAKNSKNESHLYNEIRLECAKVSRLFRNQVGTYTLIDGRFLSSGLCPGSADLIGWTPLTITAEMVGKRVAIFTAVEVKVPRASVRKKHHDKQLNFLNAVRKDGGFAFFATSAPEALRGLSNWDRQPELTSKN